MSKLWIFEKPSVASKVAGFLGKPHVRKDGYIETADGVVTWCVGHVLEQSPPDAYDAKYAGFPWKFEDLPIIPTDWKLQVSESKKKQVSVISSLLKKCTSVVNGGDEGREGQLLVDEVIYFFNCKKPVQRIMLNAMDPVSIKRAINNLQDNKNFYNLYQAALGRSRADWIYGMNFTRAYSVLAQQQNYRKVISVGRVQTPTLAIVVKRDLEIDNFIPKEFFQITANFVDPKQADLPFLTRWLPPGQTLESAEKQAFLDQNGEEGDDEDDSTSIIVQAGTQKPVWLDEQNRITDRAIAEEIVKKVKAAAQGMVSRYINKPAEEQPPLPFELTGLQTKLNSQYGFSAQSTLDVCQSLYEKGYTSYPRTDCSYLPVSQLSDVSSIMNAISQSGTPVSQYVSKAQHNLKSRAWDDSKMGEHHAIIPTGTAPDFSTLSNEEKKAYDIIAKHYVAQFFPNCLVDKAKVEISIAEERFAASGRVVKSPGWRVLFQGENTTDKEQTMSLPKLQDNDPVNCLNVKSELKQTTPPPRFTEGSLLTSMKHVHRLVSDPVEKKKLKAVEGIGRSATRAGIIETLFRRDFLEKKGKQIISTPVAKIIVQALPKNLIDPGITARWETILDGIAQGKIPLAQFEQKQGDFVRNTLNSIRGTSLPTLPSTEYTPSGGGSSKSAGKSTGGAKKGKKCPKCGQGHMVERVIKNGDKKGTKFKGCDNYPNCKHTEWVNK